MNTHDAADNATVLERELAWFRALLDLRFKAHAGELLDGDILEVCPPPTLAGSTGAYSDVVRSLELEPAERLILILACIPHLHPSLLDPFLIQNQSLHRRFTEFGGLTGAAHGGFLPTGETAVFLLVGDDLRARLKILPLLDPTHRFFTRNVLRPAEKHLDEPALAAGLTLTPEYLDRAIIGRPYHPPFSAEFPAQLITTPYSLADLVLDAATRQEVDDIIAWTRHEELLMDRWGLRKRLKPGFRSLFYGPPGTGKTMTACLLGKATDRPVYRIDLAKVVSKYIGETEKNLASLFDQAEGRRWILFFDEADSLFGKRTESRNANDRAANQQVSYLLQRIEDYPGVAILASNLRTHLDEAFSRRFQSVILFRLPTVEQRRRLWEENFKDKPYRLAADLDLGRLAREHELSGGSIINILRYSCLRAVVRGSQEIHADDVLTGVRRELHMNGKYLT